MTLYIDSFGRHDPAGKSTRFALAVVQCFQVASLGLVNFARAGGRAKQFTELLSAYRTRSSSCNSDVYVELLCVLAFTGALFDTYLLLNASFPGVCLGLMGTASQILWGRYFRHLSGNWLCPL